MRNGDAPMHSRRSYVSEQTLMEAPVQDIRDTRPGHRPVTVRSALVESILRLAAFRQAPFL